MNFWVYIGLQPMYVFSLNSACVLRTWPTRPNGLRDSLRSQSLSEFLGLHRLAAYVCFFTKLCFSPLGFAIVKWKKHRPKWPVHAVPFSFAEQLSGTWASKPCHFHPSRQLARRASVKCKRHRTIKLCLAGGHPVRSTTLIYYIEQFIKKVSAKSKIFWKNFVKHM